MNEQIQPKAYLVGRILRFSLGIFFMTEVWPVYSAVTTNGILIRLAWAIGLVIFYLLLHMMILKFIIHVNSVIGALLSFGPFLAVFILGYGGPAATGALTFLAVSLIVAAVRADSGCEVMSIPAVIAGKHTHLCCLLFSPIDSLERSITK